MFNNQIDSTAQVDWNALYKEAVNQAVLPLIFENLTENEKKTIPKEVFLKWEKTFFRYTAQNLRLLYEQNNVLELMDKNKIKCVILKGSSCAVNYPKSNLRNMGDIDILVSPKEQKKTVDILEQNGFSNVLEKEHHCHLTVFKNGISVEVHKEPNGIFVNEDSVIKEKLDNFFLKSLDNTVVENGIPMLNNKYQASVLIIHKLEHFLSGGLGLRQVCDWAVFVQKRLTEDVWKELKPLLEDFGLLLFTNAITKVCVDYLGLPKQTVPFEIESDSELSKKVIEHIISCGNFGIKDKSYGERFFVDSHSENRISSMFKVMSSACKTHWPVCKKYPILMSVAPFVVYVRYLKHRLKGERDKFQPIKLYKQSGSKQKLYKELMPFMVDGKKHNNGEMI